MRRFATSLGAALSLLFIGTSTFAGEPVTVSVDGLALVQRDATGLLFTRPAHQIGGYDAFLIDSTSILYRSERRRLDTATEDRMRQYLRDALEQELIDRGVPIADAPGPCVMRIGVTVVGLELADVPRDNGGASTTFIRSLGKMTLVTEMRDSMSGEAQLRFATKRNIAGGHYNPGIRSHRWRKIRGTADEMMDSWKLGLTWVAPSIAFCEASLPFGTLEATAGVIPPVRVLLWKL